MKVALAVPVLLLALVVAGGAAADGTSISVADALGDAVGGAADITGGTISQDPGGKLSFVFALADRPALTADDETGVFLDVDANPNTGTENGDEFLLWADAAAETVGLARWNRAEWEDVVGSSAFTEDGTTFTVEPRDLGMPQRLLAYFQTNLQSNPDAYDALGPVPFTLRPTTPPALTATRPKLGPLAPRAGKQLLASIAVTRADTGKLVSRGAVRCRATIVGKVVHTTWVGHFFTITVDGAVTGARASCSWNVPRGSVGKLIRGTITVTSDGLTVARSFSARIRR
jgi:hypothetical protein